jgi:hypothetical protein
MMGQTVYVHVIGKDFAYYDDNDVVFSKKCE